MFINFLKLHPNLAFESLWRYASEKFGVAYLYDDHHPIIAILPKSLHLLDEALKYQRDANFIYSTSNHDTHIPTLKATNNITCPNGFHGGYIFYISYDFAAQQFIQLKHKKSPTAWIAEYDIFLKYMHGQWHLFVASDIAASPQITQLVTDLNALIANTSYQQAFQLTSPLKPRWSKPEYFHAFEQVQSYLYAGDCYQINLTQEFKATVKSGELASLLPDLIELTQAPFAGYVKFGDFELLSCSPELFIEFQNHRMIKTRPIKGTLPRHKDPILDQQLKQQLSDSKKDQAENLMIVDLLRNDLSIYAETGSVHVPHLFDIESFTQVHHMVSEIQATLKAEIHPFKMLLSALPGGSITGAPKIRAMQIIDEIEGERRGAYCGSLGYFNYDGTGRSNILIRSLQRYADQLSIWAGGGITVASNAESEYQECLDKVSALLNYLNQYAETDH